MNGHSQEVIDLTRGNFWFNGIDPYDGDDYCAECEEVDMEEADGTPDN